MDPLFRFLIEQFDKLCLHTVISDTKLDLQPRLLAQLVCRQEKMSFGFSILTSRHLEQLLYYIQKRTSELRVLKIRENLLSGINGSLLSGAACRLETLDLDKTWITFGQADQLFGRISTCPALKLRTLILSRNNLFRCNSHHLSEAVCRLEEVNLWNCCLTPEQVEHLVTRIKSHEKLRLIRLNISNNNLSKISPELLSGAVSRLEEIDLNFTSISTEQIKSIFNVIGSTESKLRSVKMKHNKWLGTTIPMERSEKS